jgi:anti-sigma B factor antagonist
LGEKCPAMNPFRVGARDLESGATEIRVEGEIDLAVADRFEAVIEQSSSNARQVLIDLSACEFIDSTAIAIFLRKQRQLEAEGGRLVLTEPRGRFSESLP